MGLLGAGKMVQARKREDLGLIPISKVTSQAQQLIALTSGGDGRALGLTGLTASPHQQAPGSDSENSDSGSEYKVESY